MDDLVASLKKMYIEKLTRTFSSEKLLIFFIFLLGTFYLKSDPGDGSFVLYIQSLKFEDLFNRDSGPISKLTIGNVFFALILTYLNAVIYKWVKAVFFSYLSNRKGFESVIKKWVDKTRTVAPEGISYSTEYMKTLRARIDANVSRIIFLHAWGEVFLSIFTVVLISLNTFNRTDSIACLLLALIVVWMQRYIYVFYLANVLPEMVSEVTFLGRDFTHKDFFDKKLSNNNS